MLFQCQSMISIGDLQLILFAFYGVLATYNTVGLLWSIGDLNAVDLLWRSMTYSLCTTFSV